MTKRIRATKAEMEERRSAIYEIVAEMKPMTVRQVFYQSTVRFIIEKTEAGYDKVQAVLADMRRSGEMPFDWIADNTRWMRRPYTVRSPGEALEDAARMYRKHLWQHMDCSVQIWLEKDALAGVVEQITSAYDVPLMVARGYPSLSFLHGAAEDISELGLPAHIYHLGDYDPSGVDASRAIEETLWELAPDADINFERIAVTPSQIRQWNLPTRPTKKIDTRSKGFGEVSVELDAIAPDTLRGLVGGAINRHMEVGHFHELKRKEESERAIIRGLVDSLGAA